jgi:hypothetical protein
MGKFRGYNALTDKRENVILQNYLL